MTLHGFGVSTVRVLGSVQVDSSDAPGYTIATTFDDNVSQGRSADNRSGTPTFIVYLVRSLRPLHNPLVATQ